MNQRPQPTIWHEFQFGAAIVAWCLFGYLVIGVSTLVILLILGWKPTVSPSPHAPCHSEAKVK